MHKITKDFVLPITLSQLVLTCWVNLECDNLCLVNSELNIWFWVNSDWKQLSGILTIFYQSIEWFIEVQDFLRSYDTAPHPSRPPASPVSCLSFSVFLCVIGRAYLRESVGGGGAGVAESYDHKKAWPSMNHQYSLLKKPNSIYKTLTNIYPPTQRKKFKWKNSI